MAKMKQDSRWLQTYIRPLGAESGVVQVERVGNNDGKDGQEYLLTSGQRVEFKRPAGV
jgi:hypothetical protein